MPVLIVAFGFFIPIKFLLSIADVEKCNQCNQSCFHPHFTHASAAVNLGALGLLAMVYYEILQGNDYKKKPDYNVKKYTHIFIICSI